MTKNRLMLGALALGLSAGSAFAQPEKFVVIEEKTGTWCGWCPYGTVAFYDLEMNEPNFVGIAIHNSDPMENSYYDDASAGLPDFGGYPYAAADRAEGDHAFYSSEMFANREDMTPKAGITVTGIITGDDLEITVTADFEEAVDGDWRLAAVVTEDGVTGTGSGWGQANYFSGGSPFSGAGRDWHTEPSTVTDMVYDHVARVIADNEFNGASGSLPASISAGSSHSYTYNVTVDGDWDRSHLHVIGMLVNPDGEIDNAGKSTAGTASIDNEEVSNFSISAFPNPASDFVNLTVELQEASDVTIEVVNMLGAVVDNIGTQNLASGTYYNEINVADLTDGVYFIKTTVNEKVEMTKVVVK